MKAFIASLVLLAVLMVCSVLNCFYIDRVTGKMLDLCAEFPEKLSDGEEEMPEAIEEALSEWEKAMPRLRAASKASYIFSVSTALSSTRDYYLHGTPDDYISAKNQLIEALKALRVSDSLSFSSII